MTNNALTVLAVGDIILQMPDDAKQYFDLVLPTLKSADVVTGHVEVVFTSRDFMKLKEVPPCKPENINALSYANFNIVTLAGNHIWDSGPPGIEDTINGLQKLGIAYTGAGKNITEARKPAVVERGETRIGFLNYNCVGPKIAWAGPDKPGCSYIHILTQYEPLSGDHPGLPPAVHTFAEHTSLEAMVEDINKLRPLCDVLVVVFHKGLVSTPVTIQTYDQQVSYTAIDAGADLVLAQHAHILKGIDQYKGKVIFHSLCNFVTSLPAVLDPDKSDEKHTMIRKKIFGYDPDPDYHGYPFHPDAKKTIIAKITIYNKKITQVSYLPCWVNKNKHPEILKKNDNRWQEVFDYMNRITKEAKLNAKYEIEGDEIVIRI